MAKLSKAQCRRRLNEARLKLQKVFMSGHNVMSVQDMANADKMIFKIMNKLK